jgi:GNAT superfamily N-acetyltransferase
VSERIEAVDRPSSRVALAPEIGGPVVRRVPFGTDDPQWVIAQAEAELEARYGVLDPSEMHLTAAMFDPPSGAFLVAYASQDAPPLPLGGVGLRRVDARTGEIKRLWVDPEHRGAGLARVLMSAAESHAVGLGYYRLRLSTGDRQPEAIALYESTGWVRRDAEWGDGPIMCHSYYFTKDLAGGS